MKTLKGIVVSTKMNKTVVVRVDRQWRHPLYRKMVKRSKKYLVHDETGANEGDAVTLVEIRPMSRKKRWAVVGLGTKNKEQKTKNKKQEKNNKAL